MRIFYFYCTVGAPFLYFDLGTGSYGLASKRRIVPPGAYVLNGSVRFRCEVNRQFHLRSLIHAFDVSDPDNLVLLDTVLRTGMGVDEMRDFYGKGPADFIQLEKVRFCRLPLTGFWVDREHTIPLRRFPEAYCRCWKNELQPNGLDWKTTEVVMMSVHPKWLYRVAIGQKELESRKKPLRLEGMETYER